MPTNIASKDLPTQPGDEELVRPEDGPDSPQWGELFGRPRVKAPPETASSETATIGTEALK